MNITVYCGSRTGNDPAFAKASLSLGRWLCENGHTLVYGGGNIGLMGLIADTVLEGGGSVIGVIPEFLLDAEVGHEGLHRLEIVPDMSVRKNRMMELGDAFIAMPGGTGTLEEIAEVISLSKLGLHAKPCVFFDVEDFYRPVKDLLQTMVEGGFLDPADRDAVHFIRTPEELPAILRGGTGAAASMD